MCVVELEDNDKPSWKDIMEEANAAKFTMTSNRSAGEAQFSGLIQRNPNDGMIFFKRGEAYEAIGEPVLALADFRRAMALFPMPR